MAATRISILGMRCMRCAQIARHLNCAALELQIESTFPESVDMSEDWIFKWRLSTCSRLVIFSVSLALGPVGMERRRVTLIDFCWRKQMHCL